jgi:hypothetical protein
MGVSMLSPADLLDVWETATEDNDYDIPRPSRNDRSLASGERSYDDVSSSG